MFFAPFTLLLTFLVGLLSLAVLGGMKRRILFLSKCRTRD
jgi:hypothetical protein